MATKAINKTTAATLCFFFGIFGIHRLLMGYKNWWLMPITLGGLAFWSFWDFVNILLDRMTMANGTPLKGTKSVDQ